VLSSLGAEPNTQACAVDLALPGTLPVMNKGAWSAPSSSACRGLAHRAAPAFLRAKTTSTPDLPKGYQSSQFEIPVVQGGDVEFFWATKRNLFATGARPSGRRRRQVIA